MRTARGHRLLDDTSAGREAAEARSLPQLDGTPEQCELSGISHRCIIMDVSAKVALADLGRAFSGHARCASRAAHDAAVNNELGTGHVAGCVRGEEEHPTRV